jgi:hypothetical protein
MHTIAREPRPRAGLRGIEELDPTNAESLPQVATQAFKPYELALGRGYYTGTVWIRLHVDASAARSDALLLRVSPNHLDTIASCQARAVMNPAACAQAAMLHNAAMTRARSMLVHLSARVRP